jgi:tRNA pseudouridine55 synthase
MATATLPALMERRDVDGILLLDKPAGISSNRALQRVKGILRARKAGHTGSLDPLATGMLPICLGQATKVSAFLLDSDKTYRVMIAFGCQTATGDSEGEVVETGPASVDEELLRRVLVRFVGPVQQVPPMYSALKFRGRRLYELARTGVVVPREPREVRIREIVVEAWDPGRPVLRVSCSKGTYIRTLVEDIARQAGTVGHVAELRRLSVAPFSTEQMVTLADLEHGVQRGDRGLNGALLPADVALSGCPEVRLTPVQARSVTSGQVVTADVAAMGLVRLYLGDGPFLGVGQGLGDGRIAPRRLMTGAFPD